MIEIIIAPLDAPQIATPRPPPPPKPPRLDWIDQRLVEVVHDSGRVKTWSVLNLMAGELSPEGRAAQREARVRLLPRVRRLLRLGVLFRAGRNAVATFKPTPGLRTRRRRRTVRQTAPNKAVSAAKFASPPEPGSTTFAVPAKVFVGNPNGQETPPTGPETECAPSPAEVSLAAKSLASLPRNQPRKPTGWLHGQHCWRGRLLVLPNGEVAPLHWCSRGRVLLSGFRDDPLVDENTEFIKHLLWAVRREKDVRLYKHPEAVLLGSQKAGNVERKSQAKARAARLNGLRPCREGMRRGRPTLAQHG